MVLDQGRVAEFNTVRALLDNRKSIFYGMAKDAGLAEWDENTGRKNSVKPASSAASSQDGADSNNGNSTEDGIEKQDGGETQDGDETKNDDENQDGGGAGSSVDQ